MSSTRAPNDPSSPRAMQWDWQEYIREVASPKGLANVTLGVVATLILVSGARFFRGVRRGYERVVGTYSKSVHALAAHRRTMFEARQRLASESDANRALLIAAGRHYELASRFVGILAFACLIVAFTLPPLRPPYTLLRAIPYGAAFWFWIDMVTLRARGRDFTDPLVLSLSDEELPLYLYDEAVTAEMTKTWRHLGPGGPP